MQQNRLRHVAGLAGLIIASLLFSNQICRADNTAYDMYSWQNDSKMWCFSLTPSSKDPVATTDIKGAKDQICGRHDVKRLIGEVLPEHGVIYWKSREADGLVYPPRDIVNDLRRFAEAADYSIKLPKGESKNSKDDPWK